jgi:hypothetical protein
MGLGEKVWDGEVWDAGSEMWEVGVLWDRLIVGTGAGEEWSELGRCAWTHVTDAWRTVCFAGGCTQWRGPSACLRDLQLHNPDQAAAYDQRTLACQQHTQSRG